MQSEALELITIPLNWNVYQHPSTFQLIALFSSNDRRTMARGKSHGMLGVAQPGIASQSRFAARESLARSRWSDVRCSEGRHPLPSLSLECEFHTADTGGAPIRDGNALVCLRT